jgi:hypothetical protein
VISLYRPRCSSSGAVRSEVETPLVGVDRLVIGLETAVRRAGAATSGDRIDVLSLLLDNMEHADAFVRERSLRVLVARYAEEDATQAALQKARTDDSASVRLVAAIRDDDRSALQSIVEDARAEELVRRGAFVRLCERHLDERTLELALRLLQSGCDELIRAALQHVARVGERVDLAPIIHIAKTGTRAQAVEAVRTIERLWGERAEPVLADLVANGDQEIRIAAIDALGRVGTIASVERLRGEERVLLASELSIALSTAIELIQSRARGAGGGTLSLADGEGGGLSMTGTPGALSDPDSS